MYLRYPSPGHLVSGDDRDFPAPSYSSIAANQALVSDVETKPFLSHPSPSCFLPCQNESSSLDLSTFTQDALTSDNPPTHKNTTAVSTKASDYKAVVATPRIRAASQRRRKSAARFTCDFEGCNSDFTRRSSLDSMLISI